MGNLYCVECDKCSECAGFVYCVSAVRQSFVLPNSANPNVCRDSLLHVISHIQYRPVDIIDFQPFTFDDVIDWLTCTYTQAQIWNINNTPAIFIPHNDNIIYLIECTRTLRIDKFVSTKQKIT
jgi:hypothetical protein